VAPAPAAERLATDGFDPYLAKALDREGEVMYTSMIVGRRGENVFEPWLGRVFQLLCLVSFKCPLASLRKDSASMHWSKPTL
jgi:hypothetical protein